MIKSCYVVNSENIYWWFDTKQDAEDYILEARKEGQEDIRFTYSKCEINKVDKNDFKEIKVLEIILP
jgi:hypothetical protein